MNYAEAKSLALALIADRDTPVDHELRASVDHPGIIVQVFNILDEGTHRGDELLAERIAQKFNYTIANYDERGNWTGSVSGENGWTP